MVATYVPDRGDLVWLDFDPQSGREQAKTRPALVLSPRRYNRLSQLILACPITSQAKGYPFEVAIPTALKTRGVVLADQVRSLDWKVRRARRIEGADTQLCRDVTERIMALLVD